MVRTVLSDTKWEGIKDFLPGKAGDCGVTAKDNRRFVEAMQRRMRQRVVPNMGAVASARAWVSVSVAQVVYVPGMASPW